MTEVHELELETKRLLSSSQVIISVRSVVKELIENSLDANATNITVRLINSGLNSIEIKDDGCGVSEENVQKMCLSGHTSKIKQFSDIDNLETYGFRGEALSAICKIAEVCVSTKTDNDSMAKSYLFDSFGNVKTCKPAQLLRGTQIQVTNIFHNLPVRKQYLSSKKKLLEELKSALSLVQALCIIHPQLRLVYTHNDTLIWQKNRVSTLKQSFMQYVGLKKITLMEQIGIQNDQYTIDLIIPKKNALEYECLKSSSGSLIYVNKRNVVAYKEITKLIEKHISRHFINDPSDTSNFLILLSIVARPDEIDCNLEPDKSRVLLKHLDVILDLIDLELSKFYGHDRVIEAPTTVEDVLNIEPIIEPVVKRLKQDEDWKLKILENVQRSPSRPLNIESQSISCDRPITSGKLLCSQINIASRNFQNNTEELLVANSEASSVMRENIQINSQNSENVGNQITDLIDNSKSFQFTQGDTQHEDSTVRFLKSSGSVAGNDLTNFTENFTRTNVVREDIQSVATFNATLVNSSSATDSEQEAQAINEAGQYQTDANISETSDVTVSTFQWSKGHVELDNQKKFVEGPTVLKPVTKNSNNDSAFTKFSQLMRRKVIEDNPGILFNDVSTKLAEKWSKLAPNEKEHYETIPKTSEKEKSTNTPFEMKQKIFPTAKPNLNFSKSIKRPPRKEKRIQMCFEKIVKLRNCQRDRLVLSNWDVCGPLESSNIWFVLWNSSILSFTYTCLKESVLFDSMLKEFDLPRVPLEHPMYVEKETLPCWNILVDGSLPLLWNSTTSRYKIAGDVITKNGFEIELSTGHDMETKVIIHKMPCLLDINESIITLNEALKLFETYPNDVRKQRPQRVVAYIKDEVSRVTAQSQTQPSVNDVQELLSYYKNLNFNFKDLNCLHNIRIFKQIYSID